MNIAVLLHPEHFDFDLQSSADEFYETFYNIPFTPDDINRSFSKPSSKLRLLMDKQ